MCNCKRSQEQKGEGVMSKYVDNVNTYLSQMKIKQKYISLKSGIDEKKLSRILSSGQKINSDEMESIAGALGHKVEYFLADHFTPPVSGDLNAMGVAFYAGEPMKEQQEFAMKLIDLIENIDEVLSAKNRFENAFME